MLEKESPGNYYIHITQKSDDRNMGCTPNTWWRHQMKTLSALLAICAGNSPVTGEFPAQRPVTRSFICFDLGLNNWLSKQLWGSWFETPLSPLWCHCNTKNLQWPLFQTPVVGNSNYLIMHWTVKHTPMLRYINLNNRYWIRVML